MDSKKLEKAEAKLKQKQEKKAADNQTRSETNNRFVIICCNVSECITTNQVLSLAENFFSVDVISLIDQSPFIRQLLEISLM